MRISAALVVLFIILVGLILASIIVYILSKRKSAEEQIIATKLTGCGKCTFLSKKQTEMLLQQDSDGYIRGLTLMDLCARRVSSRDEYRILAVRSAGEFTDDEKDRLNRLTCDIDRMAQAKGATLQKYGIDAKRYAAIPWNLAITRKYDYEHGFPHTRGTTVFLSNDALTQNDDGLKVTLFHEKVHLYQKTYPADARAYIDSNGYKLKGERVFYYPDSRSNPDIDKYVYTDKDGRVLVARYTKECPASLNDIDIDYREEHPFEVQAYQSTADVFKTNTDDDIRKYDGDGDGDGTDGSGYADNYGKSRMF